MATDGEIIAHVRASLENWALGDIFKCVRVDPASLTDETKIADDAPLIATFALCSALIDALLCYRYNSDSTRDLYRAFVRDYVGAQYNGADNDLYLSFRCGLLHNYLPRNVAGRTTTQFALTHNNRAKHLVREGDFVWLNLQNVLIDVRNAAAKFFKEAETDGSETRANTIARAKTHGWLGLRVKPKASPPSISEPPKVSSAIPDLSGLFDLGTFDTTIACLGASSVMMTTDIE